MLYPALLSWLCALPGNYLIWLRMGDMLVAAWACWLFCRLLERESRSHLGGMLLGLILCLALNHPAVIQAGFKNSIFAAYIPLLMAVQLARTKNPENPAWLTAGMLTALGVLLREPFAIFAVVGVMAVWLGHGWNAAWRYVAGGLLGGLLILCLVGMLRGGISTLLYSYIQSGAFYGPEAERTWHSFVRYGLRTLAMFWPLFVLTILAILVIVKSPEKSAGRVLFWVAAAVLPLLEPLSKLGFVYHFAVMLPGCAGLCALAWRKLELYVPHWKNKALSAIGLTCMFMAVFIVRPGLSQTLAVWRNHPSPYWSTEVSQQSNTLLAAAKLRTLVPHGGTLSISGFTYLFYPATGMQPPSPLLSDLSRTFILCDYNKECLLHKIQENPPDIIVIAQTEKEHAAIFSEDLKSVVDMSGIYNKVADIPEDMSKNYGWLGYSIYQLTVKQ